MGTFFDRIQSLIDDLAGGKHTVFAKKAGIPPSTFQKYLSEKMPVAEHLIRIHETYGVSVDWLLTGNGGPYVQDECIKENLAAYGDANATAGNGVAKAAKQKQEIVDRDLLVDTIRVVEEWLVRNKRKLPPEKKAEVILYLYEEYLEREEKPETATVERLLKLVA